MLKIIRSFKQLDFSQLKKVYSQSLQEKCDSCYSNEQAEQQILLCKQELYGEVKCFFEDKNAFYAVWEVDGRYVSVLRMEPYKDGLLLEGLETTPDERCKGYAKQLVLSVLSELRSLGKTAIYSHIHKKNAASIAVHLACGFQVIRDCAVFADGSVSQQAYTLQKTI